MASSDSSEIVTHLRTVHFFLVVACILVVLSLLSGSPDIVNTAHKQLQKILTIKTNWPTWTQRFGLEQITWLQKQKLAWPDTIPSQIYILPEESKLKGLPWVNSVLILTPLYSPMYFHLSVKRQAHTASSREEILGSASLRDGAFNISPGGYDERTPGDDAVGSPLLNTLEDFRHFWNAADNVMAFVVAELSEVVYLVSNGHVKAELRWDAGLRPKGGISLSLDRRGFGQIRKKCPDELQQLWESQWLPTFNEYFCGQAPTGTYPPETQTLVLLAKVRHQQLPTDLRVWLAEEFKFSTAGGKFEEQFSELNEVTKYIQKLELSNVNQVLTAELQRSGERMELLGMKLPERILSTWGTVVIVIIQLYFWLHLRAFRSRWTPNDPGLNLAWVGLYTDFWARIVLFISLFVLPLGVTAYLVYQNGWFTWVSVFWVLGLFLLTVRSNFEGFQTLW